MKARLGDPILREFPRWQSEQRYLANIGESLDQLAVAFKAAVDSVDVDELDLAAPTDAPNEKQLAEIDKFVGKVEAGLGLAKAAFETLLKGLRKELNTADKAIRPAYDAQKKRHAAVVSSLGSPDSKKATTRFDALQKRLVGLKKKVGERTKLEAKVEQLVKHRKQLLARLESARAGRSAKRKTKAAEYEAALKDILEIRVDSLGDRSEFRIALRSLSRGGRVPETDLEKMSRVMAPSELLSLIHADDSDALAARVGISPEAARRFVDACAQRDPADLYDLEIVSLNDLPMISYFVEPGRLKPVHELSTGQKGTVIISLALIEGPGPLVVDHPEEPLDTKSVYAQVVSKLRDGKEHRQFIFTTHNANIAVGADADLSHILGATADKGTIESCGAVDDAKTNELLLLHLEGGSAALGRRIKKYRTA